MSKENTLLNSLDALYGGVDVSNSHFKATKQGYDNDKHEFYAVIEYRYRRSTGAEQKEYRRSVEKQKRKNEARQKAMQVRKQQTLNLLRQINNNAGRYVTATG